MGRNHSHECGIFRFENAEPAEGQSKEDFRIELTAEGVLCGVGTCALQDLWVQDGNLVAWDPAIGRPQLASTMCAESLANIREANAHQPPK